MNFTLEKFKDVRPIMPGGPYDFGDTWSTSLTVEEYRKRCIAREAYLKAAYKALYAEPAPDAPVQPKRAAE